MLLSNLLMCLSKLTLRLSQLFPLIRQFRSLLCQTIPVLGQRRLLGDKVEAVITRLLGVLLAALAAQYVIDGLKGSFGFAGSGAGAIVGL